MTDGKRIVKMVDTPKPAGENVVLKDQQRNARVNAINEHIRKPKVMQKK